MSANGQHLESATSQHVLRWSGRVLSVADLRCNLNGHRELVLAPHTVVTPLAGDELRGKDVQVSRSTPAEQVVSGQRWGCGQDRPYAMVRSAVQTLARDGVTVHEWPAPDGAACRWAKRVAEWVVAGEGAGGAVFCEDPGLVCCVANKVPGLRAVAVTTVGQAARATLTLAANLLVVEMPGRTFFEVRQILKMLGGAARPCCPEEVAWALRSWTGMRIAEVIGTVTLSRVHPSLTGARWVIGVPFSLKALRADGPADGEDLVIFDNLGSGMGSRIGFSEGGEAATPFYPEKKPVDAFCACLLDQVVVSE